VRDGTSIESKPTGPMHGGQTLPTALATPSQTPASASL